MTSFHEKLTAASRKNESLVCVGLDPDPALMPIDGVLEFNKAIIDATADLVCCYKPNVAFYEALGFDGLQALKGTLEYIKPKGIPVIGDGKRGDIGSTAKAYAKAVFDFWEFDAVTVSPYLGKDSLEPFLEYADKGVLVLCHTSSPGSSDFQDLLVGQNGSTRPLFKDVALKVQKWNTRGNAGLVMGATYPHQLQAVRRLCPDMVILAPGVGAQGGDLENTVKYGVNADGEGLIINSSRGIIYASKNQSDFDKEARRAADDLRQAINVIRGEVANSPQLPITVTEAREALPEPSYVGATHGPSERRPRTNRRLRYRRLRLGSHNHLVAGNPTRFTKPERLRRRGTSTQRGAAYSSNPAH